MTYARATANAGLAMWPRSADVGVNDICCGPPNAKAAATKTTMSATLRSVETSWNALVTSLPHRCTAAIAQTIGQSERHAAAPPARRPRGSC